MKKILLLVFALLCVFSAAALAEDEPLFIAQEGCKQGFINARGEWVIAPEYEKVCPFTDAGYAAVVTAVHDPGADREPFMLIDRQGKVIAELPEWSLDYTRDRDIWNPIERPNAIGNVFVLWAMEENRYALYLADTGEIIELDQAFLGYELSPGAEEYAAKDFYGTRPYEFSLSGWKDHLVLEFRYTDYKDRYTDYKDKQGFACYGFVILDRQGHKLHEGCLDGRGMGYTESGWITDSYILTGEKYQYGNSPRNLIDSDGKIILKDLTGPDVRWEEEIQAVAWVGEDKVMLPDGQVKPLKEHLKQLAAEKPNGIGKYGWYYDTEGEWIAWPGAEWRESDPSIEDDFGWDYLAMTEFGEDGRAWTACWYTTLTNEAVENRLVETDGRILMTVNLVSEHPETTEFDFGWECVYSDDGRFWKYGYINPAGEMMFGGYVFDAAEPFYNGLAHVQYMDDRCELLDAYINPEGGVVWAEYGKQEEVQRWLEEGKRFSIDDLTLEEATKALAGEWDCTGGSERRPFILYEDGTGMNMRKETFTWRLVDNRDGSAVPEDVPFWETGSGEDDEDPDEEDEESDEYDEFPETEDEESWTYDEEPDEEEWDEEEGEDQEPYWLEFLLVYGDGEITRDNTDILIFINRDEFFFSDGEGSSSFGRVAPGGLERRGYFAFYGDDESSESDE